MPLNRALAVALADIVHRDPECRRRIDSGFAVLGTQAGSFRNLAYFLDGVVRRQSVSPSPEQAKMVCFGIAEAAIEAINAAAQAKRPAKGTLAPLKFASEIGRNVGESGEHYAVKITMREGSAFTWCVFDWWATLRTDDPLIYRTVADFLQAQGGITLSRFVAEPG